MRHITATGAIKIAETLAYVGTFTTTAQVIQFDVLNELFKTLKELNPKLNEKIFFGAYYAAKNS